MRFRKALLTAESKLIDRPTLAEIKRASQDLRSAVPDSVLADLVDARVRAIESHWKHRFGWALGNSSSYPDPDS
jgi:hypothetical protein